MRHIILRPARPFVGLALAAIAALVASGSSAACLAGQIESASRELRPTIDDVVAPFVDAGDFMGVVAAQRAGQTARAAPYGWASLELETPHREDGIFMIGSISKQFTAVAILLLEEDGKLRTDDEIASHLEAFRARPPITIHQLLTHTSGVMDVYSLDRFGATAGASGSFDDVIADLARLPLTFEPGRGYAYSNGGYSVLAALVERASGMTYGEFLRERIFEPLGLERTAHASPGPAVTGRVLGYDPWGGNGLEPAPPVAPAFLAGSGSIWSSAADLLRWTHALHEGEVLSADSYEKLVHDHGYGYGYGVSVFTRFGRPAIGHDGRVSGFASDLAYYPSETLAVVVLSNVQSVARDQIRVLAAAAVLGEDYPVPPRRVFTVSSQPLAGLEGDYAFGPDFVVSVTRAGDRLLARANQGGYSELVPIDGGAWFSRMLYATVRFARNEEGVVDRLLWGAGDEAPVGVRRP